MSLNVFWFLPTHGDGHYLGSAQGARSVDHGYLQQIAQAADRLGFGGVLIPTGRSCEDSWLVAASLIPVTQRLKFLVALRPGIISPTLAARQAATLDRLSNGRACSIWSPAAIRKSWRRRGYISVMKSVTKPRPSSLISGAGCWKVKPSISTASIFR